MPAAEGCDGREAIDAWEGCMSDPAKDGADGFDATEF